MSSPPHVPCPVRLLTKKNVCPSRAIVGQKSFADEFTGAPTFTGAPHGSPTFSRVATQMSIPPRPPDRLDAMKNFFPSGETKGQPSSEAMLNAVLVPGICSTEIAVAHGV